MTQFSFGSGFGLYSYTPCSMLYDGARTKVTNAGTVRQQMPPLTKRSPEVPSRPRQTHSKILPGSRVPQWFAYVHPEGHQEIVGMFTQGSPSTVYTRVTKWKFVLTSGGSPMKAPSQDAQAPGFIDCCKCRQAVGRGGMHSVSERSVYFIVLFTLRAGCIRVASWCIASGCVHFRTLHRPRQGAARKVPWPRHGRGEGQVVVFTQ